MGNGPSREIQQQKNTVWYKYTSTRCVSDNSGSLKCVTIRGNSNSNSRANGSNTKRTNANSNINASNVRRKTNTTSKKKTNTTSKKKTIANNTNNNNNNNRTLGLRKHGRRGILGSVW